MLRNTSEKAKEFEDMREAFADGSVEAVSIATPNHWHALAAIWAMKAGKDVYGEKPACYNIYEGQKMIQVARETKRMMQVGSQHRSTPFKMKAMEAIHGGLIGKVYQSKGLCFKRRASISMQLRTWDIDTLLNAEERICAAILQTRQHPDLDEALVSRALLALGRSARLRDARGN